MRLGAVAVTLVGLLLFVGPPLDGLAGYLLIREGYRAIGAFVLAANAVAIVGVLLPLLPRWLPLPGHALVIAVVLCDVTDWLGLLALAYAVSIHTWLPALLLLAGVVFPEIGGLAVTRWSAANRRG